MKITLAQLNYIVGDFEYNLSKIIEAIKKAKNEKSDLIIFTELAVCGYPPLDLLENKEFIEKCVNSINKIIGESEEIGIIIGTPWPNNKNNIKKLLNAAIFIYQKKIQKIISKTLLPDNDYFNEYHYFDSNLDFYIIEFKNKKFGITICEDLWLQQTLICERKNQKIYDVSPIEELISQNPDFIINISASPFTYMQNEIRKSIINNVIKKYKIPIIYVNQVGANTDLIFDGNSFVSDSNATIRLKLPAFEENITTFDLNEVLKNDLNNKCNYVDFNEEYRIEQIVNALILGIKDFFSKLGFEKAILGLSGGIDSAVVCTLAVEALGNENVLALLMPSMYSTKSSIDDSIKLAKNLGINYKIININEIYNCYLKNLEEHFSGLPFNVAEENLQARIRANILMSFSNKFGYVLLNTSNKSEISVGYGTLYGDITGAISVIGDVYKTDIYRIASYINREREIIPKNIIDKVPSAELRENQKDTDSLPPYEILDNILFHYIELEYSYNDLIEKGFDKSTVEYVLNLINKNEFKRYQSPPILRISPKAFGPGKHIPLVANFDFMYK